MPHLPRSLTFVAFLLCLIMAASAFAQDKAADAEKDQVGWLVLDSSLREGPIRQAWVTEGDAGPSLRGVLNQIQAVADSPQHKGLVVHLDMPAFSATQADALHGALLKLRKSGKKVITFAQAYDTTGYMIASAGNIIALQHKGSVEMMGMHLEEMYLGGLMGKLGIQPNFIQVGKYKGASEQMTRKGPSDAWSQNMDNLLDGMYGQVISSIANGRGLSAKQVEANMTKSWMLDDRGLLKAGIVDRLVRRDMKEMTEAEFGNNFAWDTEMGKEAAGGMNAAIAANPMMMLAALMQDPVTETNGPTIKVIHANGAIISGDSSYGDGLFGGESIGSRTLTEMLGDALDDDNVKGVVLRIDSPGGSALASEVMWQAIREFSEAKPLVCSVGGMAASGGYYLASGCDHIVIEPRAIVGSIGVVAGKMNLEGLYDLVGISVHTRSRGPNAALLSSVNNFTDEERAKLKKAMEMVYEQFRERVATGRGDRLKDLDAVDEGLLFTGSQAVKNGMADEIGGLDEAIAQVAKRAKLEDGKYAVMELPHPMSLATYLESLFDSGGMLGLSSPQNNAALVAAKKLVGDAAWSQLTRSMHGLTLLKNERTLLLMPQAIVVK